MHEMMTMDRKDLNLAIDVVMGISFLVCFMTGVIKFPSVLGYILRTFGSLPLYWISWVHDYSGLAFGILGIVHILLHRRWLSAMIRRKLGMLTER